MNTTTALTTIDVLKVGDPIRVANLDTGTMHKGKVAALFPEDKAISVDVRKGVRIYFRTPYMGAWMLYDLAPKVEPTTAEDIEL